MISFSSSTGRLQRLRSPQKRGAFSLIEVAFALVIFVIGAMALLRIFPTGLSVIQSSGNARLGATIANEYLGSYTSSQEDLGRIPSAVYDATYQGGQYVWNDFPGSMASDSRTALSLPKTIDDYEASSLGHFQFIRGERSPVNSLEAAASVRYLPARRQVSLYREGIVTGVKIRNNGEVDFNDATYMRSDLNVTPPVLVGFPFREPTIRLNTTDVGVATPTNLVEPATATTAYNVRLRLDLGTATGTQIQNYNNQAAPSVIVTVGDPANVIPAANRADNTTDYALGNAALATGTRLSFTSDGQGGYIDIPITVNADATPEDNQFFYIYVSGGLGCSVRSSRFLCCIPANEGTAATGSASSDPSPTTDPPLLSVRPPFFLRAAFYTAGTSTLNANAQPVSYTVSYAYTQGTRSQGVIEEPMKFPVDDANFPQSSTDWTGTGPRPGLVPGAYRGGTVADGNDIAVRFRQYLGTQSAYHYTVLYTEVSSRGGLPSTIADVVALNYTRSAVTNVSLDYSIQDWRYICDYLDTGTNAPFPSVQLTSLGDNNAPGKPNNFDLIATAFHLGSWRNHPENIREYRAPIPNIRGPVISRVDYFNAAGALSNSFYPVMDERTTGTGGAKEKEGLARYFKEGRLYFPISSVNDVATPAPRTRIQVMYRNKDDWTRQLGAVALHYTPFNVYAPASLPTSNSPLAPEPWREYALGNDGRLYFHASEAGKTVQIKVKQNNPANEAYTNYTIDSRLIAVASAPGVPASFAPSGKVSVISDPVVDMTSPNGVLDVAAVDYDETSSTPPMLKSMQGRTVKALVGRVSWLNNDNYQQAFSRQP